MTIADDATRAGLHRVGGQPPLLPYLREVWERRQLIFYLAKFRLEAENGRNRLGIGWVVLKPLMQAGVYGLVFGLLLQTRKGVDDFLPFLVIGVMLFEYFTSCFTTGAKSITANAALVQSLSFPRMCLPIALVGQRFMQFIPMVGIMALVSILNHNYPTLQWLLLIPLVALFTVFNMGLTLITARLTVHFRDLTQLLPFISRVFFYTSGIFFSVAKRFGEDSVVRRISDKQPIHEFLTLGRAIFLRGPDYTIPVDFWVFATIWSFGILATLLAAEWLTRRAWGLR